MVSVSDTTTPAPRPAPVHQLAALCSSGLLCFLEKSPKGDQKPTSPGFRKWTKAWRTRKNVGGKKEHSSVGRGFQLRAPFTASLSAFSWDRDRVGGMPPLPLLQRFCGLAYFLPERTNRKEKPFFGISAWKHSRLVITIFRIDPESKSPVCNSHPSRPGLGGGQGGVGESTELFPLLSPFSQTPTDHPSLILPS